MEIDINIDSLRELHDTIKKLPPVNGKKDKRYIEVNGTKICFSIDCREDAWWINSIEEMYSV